MKWREKSSARIEKPSACPAITVQRENSRRIRRRKAYGFDSSRKNADSALIAKRDYGYDARDRVVSRVQTRGNGESATTRTDAFSCNTRSELTSATLGNAAYAYAFDYIGNRATASEAGTQLAYAANALNQYATITETEAFTPTYDADGNATLIKTATGTWSISCNGENRPVRFENAGTQTVVECGYDSLGRRFEKKVTVAGTLVLHERYAYRGYLQIAAFDVAGTQEPALKRVIYWDPTEETATRPLAVNILGDNVYFPTVDLTKNVCELVDFYGNVAATYDYAPFGNVSAASPSGSAVPANPLQWSSEICDSELDLVYYNYRHYSPSLGRFLSRDPIEEQGGRNLYAFCENRVVSENDTMGLLFMWLPVFGTIETLIRTATSSLPGMNIEDYTNPCEGRNRRCVSVEACKINISNQWGRFALSIGAPGGVRFVLDLALAAIAPLALPLYVVSAIDTLVGVIVSGWGVSKAKDMADEAANRYCTRANCKG